jgi:hypothetical protein
MRHPSMDQQFNTAVREEIGRRLRTFYDLAGRQKLPRYIRLLIDRLVEQEQKSEQPTMRCEGWLRRFFAGGTSLE